MGKFRNILWLEIIYIGPTGSNKRKNPRKFDVNTLAPKIRHIKSDQQKLLRTMMFVAKKQYTDT